LTLSRRPLPIKMSSACSSYCPILAETVHYDFDLEIDLVALTDLSESASFVRNFTQVRSPIL